MTDRYALFDTPVGRCAIGWSEVGLWAFQLPERDDHATRLRMTMRRRDAVEARPTPAIEAAIAAIRALLSGERRDLLDLVLDEAGTSAFNRRVYAHTRRILPGSVSTYGEVAQALGEPGASRAVGQALGSNPWAVIVPCHRVLAAGHKAGGFSAAGGTVTKLRLLEIEGARLGGQPGLFDPAADRVRSGGPARADPPTGVRRCRTPRSP